VRGAEVLQRAARDDPRRVDVRVAAVVVRLDLVELAQRRDAGELVEVAEVVREVRVVGDPPQVALEVAVVDGVEADMACAGQTAKEFADNCVQVGAGYVAADPDLPTPLYLQAGNGELPATLTAVAEEILDACVPG
jgi:hypothetical protein